MKLEDILLNDRTVQPFCRKYEKELEEILFFLTQAESIFEDYFSVIPEHTPKWVQEFTFMSIESVISATRLLIEGHVNPSGNTMRVAYESLCMSILLTSEEPLEVSRNKPLVVFNEAFEQNHGRSKPYLSVEHVINNAERLGLSEGLGWLKEAKNFYNAYSHSSLISMGSLILRSRTSVIAGGYHPEKHELYTSCLTFIVRYSRLLPELVAEIGKRNLTNSLRGIPNARDS
jgi:hypothetical protein